MELDLNLIRRGLKKILISTDRREATATADILLAYMDSMDGKPVDTEPEISVAHESDTSSYTIVYTQKPPNMVEVIKDIRNAISFGLKEAKDFVEGIPFRDATKTQTDALRKIASRHNIPVSVSANEQLDF